MRKLFLLLLAAGIILTGCNVISGSGDVISEERQTSQFAGVSLSGTGELTVIQADDHSVWIEAEDNIVPLIITEVRGDILHIGTKPGVSFRNTEPIKYIVTTPDIEKLDLSGSGSIFSESIDSKTLDLDVSGSGEMTIEDIAVDVLSAKISGSGSISAQGEAGYQDITISGSGEYDSPELGSDTVEIDVSGSGQADVWAKELLTVDISGSGDVSYHGQPQVDESISGSGRIKSGNGR